VKYNDKDMRPEMLTCPGPEAEELGIFCISAEHPRI